MRAIILLLSMLSIPCAAQSIPANQPVEHQAPPQKKQQVTGDSQPKKMAGVDDLQAGLSAYQNGNYAAAMQKLIPLANAGDATAQLRLGEMNEKGQAVSQNYQRAAVRYRQAAEQGNAEAQYHLGMLYDLGRGVRQNKKIAAEWFAKSAAQGYEKAKSFPAPEHVFKAATPAALTTGQIYVQTTTLPEPNLKVTPLQHDAQPAVAHKETPTKLPTSLPGIGKLSGNQAVFNASVIRVSDMRNEVVYVSNVYPNRIATPFRRPMLVGTLPAGYTDDTIGIVGSSMYFPAIEKSFAVFITGNDPGDQVVSLTFMPKDIPTQIVTLMLDGGENASVDRKEASPDSYTDALVSKFRSIAMGKVPTGFSSAKLPQAIAKTGALIIIPEKRFSGQKLDIYRYRVENTGTGGVELAETAFYETRVRGVAIYPNIRLDAGEFTYVFVASDKELSHTGLDEILPLAAGE